MKKKQKKKYGRPAPKSARAPHARTHPTHDRRTRRENKTAEGIFSGTKNGYGFVEVPGMERDIFVPAGKTCGALDGDTVAVRYHLYESDGILRTDGEITRIIALGRTTIIGTVFEETFVGRGHRRAPRLIVEPSDTRFSQEVVLRDADGVRPGDKVEVILPPRTSYYTDELYGTLKRNFGRATGREANYEAILAECDIPVLFEEEALREAEKVAAIPLTEAGRCDRRGEIIFTIDGADAKDLDDAVSLTRRKNGNWSLGVHIADVSHYVTPKTALDRAAMSRGTSLYFTDQVVPMLPVALSNGACSLNVGEDKYAMSCEIEIAPDGTLMGCTLARSIIRSVVRGVYSEVNDLFDKGEKSAYYEKYREVYPTLSEMHALYLVLAKRAAKRGAMDLEQTEARILLDENGFPTDIVPRTRGDAEKLIEQFMLAANESVATRLYAEEKPCVYRIHEKPSKEKLAEFVLFAHNMGFDTSYITAADPTGCDFSRLLEEAKARGVGTAISYSLLRAMAKARYSDAPALHFGLGIEHYAHFTSPIRRLSDLATHRLIGAVLLDGEPANRYRGYAHRAAEAASETELRALTAERRIDALYKALYLSRRLGEEYLATVSSVTRFGIFATLDNTCEGLIPMTEIPGMWFYDEGNMVARCADARIAVGDRITIRIEEADVSRGKVRFSLISISKKENEIRVTPEKPGSSSKIKGERKPVPSSKIKGEHKPVPSPKKETNKQSSGKRAPSRTARPRKQK